MKEHPIVMGFDDATYDLKSGDRTTQLIGVVCQGTRMIKTVRKKIQIDGIDASKKLIELVNQHKKHVQYIMTDTITFGGFNIVDLEMIYEETEKPIVAVTEHEVDLESVKNALIKKFPNNYEQKLRNIINAGNLYETEIDTAGGPSKTYFHCKGIEIDEIEVLFKKTCIDSKLPECVRIAHLIGRIF